MAALSNDAEVEVLRFLTGQGGPDSGPNGGTVGEAPEGPVLPLKVALLTNTITDDTTEPAEVVKGASGYVRQNVYFAAVGAPATPGAPTQTTNTNVVRFENMPEVPTVAAFAVYDSAATPRRWWQANLTNPRQYAAGDAAEFPVGELVLEVR